MKYGKLEVLSEYKGFSLCVENNKHYFIKGLSEYYVDISSTKENLLSELKRWVNEIDFNNEYMKDIENHFIGVLLA